MILILKITFRIILIWNRLQSCDFDFKSLVIKRFWFWLQIFSEMILSNTAYMYLYLPQNCLELRSIRLLESDNRFIIFFIFLSLHTYVQFVCYKLTVITGFAVLNTQLPLSEIRRRTGNVIHFIFETCKYESELSLQCKLRSIYY